MSDLWNELATSIGYIDEAEMWQVLYTNRKWSIKRIADVIGCGTYTIRRRLIKHSVAIRSQGGSHPTHHSRMKLLRMDPRQAVHGSLIEAARLANLDKSTIWHFRRWVNETSVGMSNIRSREVGST